MVATGSLLIADQCDSPASQFFWKCVSQPKHPWCIKSCSQESKKGHTKKDVKSEWAPKPPAVDGIKIFDNDDHDQVAKHHCCLPL